MVCRFFFSWLSLLFFLTFCFKSSSFLICFIDLYALSRYVAASSRSAQLKPNDISYGPEQVEVKQVRVAGESELRLAQLQHQLPANEPGALMNLVEDASGENEDDKETRECKSLFKNLKFFLSREVSICLIWIFAFSLCSAMLIL